MNKNMKLILVACFAFLLSSCQLNINQQTSSEDTSGSSIISNNSSEGSDKNSSNDISELKKLSISQTNFSPRFKYTTGNYGSDTTSGINFGYYRCHREGTELVHLVPYDSNVGVEELDSAFYNINPIKGIKRIELVYHTASLQGEMPVIKYGKDRFVENKKTIPMAITSSERGFDFSEEEISYFSIETQEVKISIQSITIYYSNESIELDNKKKNSGENKYRINLETLDQSKLVSGVTKVEVPTQISIHGDLYQVEATKEYTYYSYEYIRSNPEFSDEASLIDPVDVANYFISFGIYPANYVYKNNYYEATEYFGEETRCVSTYSRTDGYATAVPYATDKYGSPYYYECDIALDDTYSKNNRGVGRLVVWEYGFSNDKGGDNYNSSPVAVFTDDHYATFKEYLNYGLFTDNFDAELSKTYVSWSSPKTLNKK